MKRREKESFQYFSGTGLKLVPAVSGGEGAQSDQVAQSSDQMSFLHQCLPPVQGVVWSVCEGEDGRVH